MTIQHEQQEGRGTFFIPGDNGNVAEMTYMQRDQKTIIIDHTYVSEELRGKNIGYQLVHQAVEFARTDGLKIMPVCVFARAVFEKKPEFNDVLKKEIS